MRRYPEGKYDAISPEIMVMGREATRAANSKFASVTRREPKGRKSPTFLKTLWLITVPIANIAPSHAVAKIELVILCYECR
jgi:hypothetical protein